MDNLLKIYSVSDKYIDFLRNKDGLSLVFDNKTNNRTHTRKYIGVAFKIHNFNYFIPFSSPKPTDYITDNNGNKIIRKNTATIIRMISNNNNNIELNGTLKINNMIPVPESELEPYNIKNEADLKYRDLVNKEYSYIIHNYKIITKNAELIYKQKTLELNAPNSIVLPNYIKSIIPFNVAEKACKEYIDREAKKTNDKVCSQKKVSLKETMSNASKLYNNQKSNLNNSHHKKDESIR